MINRVLLFIGAAVTILWGISHLIPTRAVVKGFGTISSDNKNIITMEWIVEGFALIFIGAFVAIVTINDLRNPVSTAVYLLSAFGLIVLALISLFTGFKVNFLPFKLCPFIFIASAVLIFIGWIV